MPDYELIGSADYIIRGYVDAADELATCERTGDRSAVRRAAAALCWALTRLAEEEALWRELRDVYRSPPTRRHEALGHLHDLQALLDLERQALEDAGLSHDEAASIADEAVEALVGYEDWPDEVAADQVREAVATAARAACVEASFKQSRRPSRRLERAMGAGTGAVVIVANARYAPDGIKELSIYAGGRLIEAGVFRDWKH